jgi:two-component system LytT family response regulator
MIRIFIVEDEPMAVQRLSEFVARENGLEIVGSAASGIEAVEQINSLEPDLVFLDIHLEDISGLDILRMIACRPAVIFTTAYDQYAVKAFEYNAVDYLLKPFDHQRFHQGIEKAEMRLSTKEIRQDTADQLEKLLQQWHPKGNYLTRIPSKRGDKIQILADDDIVYITSENKLVFAFRDNSKHLLNYTLDELTDRLDPEKFFRIHRSTIVNLNFVKTIEASFGGGYRLTVNNTAATQLAVSRSAGKLLRRKLNF